MSSKKQFSISTTRWIDYKIILQPIGRSIDMGREIISNSSYIKFH